jgi:hypothetical protein
MWVYKEPSSSPAIQPHRHYRLIYKSGRGLLFKRPADTDKINWLAICIYHVRFFRGLSQRPHLQVEMGGEKKVKRGRMRRTDDWKICTEKELQIRAGKQI